MTKEELNRGALYLFLDMADHDVEFFAQFGLVAKVVPDGRFWRVNVSPRERHGDQELSRVKEVYPREISAHCRAQGENGLDGQ